jgi:arginine-tRNA-protein transferase
MQERQPHRFFVGTRAMPCPYLPDRVERKVVTNLAVPNAADMYDVLSRAGFRRSHGLAYRPACPGCNACVPVRIVVGKFTADKSFRRVLRANADLVAEQRPARATMEQYELFTLYQNERHEGGDMSSMSYRDYRAMVEDSPVDTHIVEYRDRMGELMAVMLADRQADALSAVYSFFLPDLGRRSLGNYMVLSMIGRARELSLPYVYLGYWIPDSRKMGYKARFRPLEGLRPGGWAPIRT